LLLEVFGRPACRPSSADWLFESLGLPIQWRPRGPGASRTLARVAPAGVFFHEAGLDRSAGDLIGALSRPCRRSWRAPRELAESLIDSARVAMATRQRELHAFSYPNPDDVLVVRPGRGLTLASSGSRRTSACRWRPTTDFWR